jgi:hypothetical protein
VSRRALLRFAGWFTAVNVLLCCLVGLRYLFLYQWPDTALGVVYPPLAMLGNFTLLLALAMALALGPLVAVVPRRRAVTVVAVVVAAAALALLVLDSNVFAERRLHLSLLVAVLFEPATWIAAALIFAIALAFEAMLAAQLWRWLAARPAAGGRWLALALAASWAASQALHVWADATGYAPVTRFTQMLPLYYPQTAKRQLARLGLVDPARVREASLLRRSAGTDEGELNYPLAPLDCAPPAEPPNVLWIVVDGLRPDAVDPALTPVLAGLRASALSFEDHWSSGNSSRMAAFGMFYGLPSTYFDAFYVAERAPLLLDRFRAAGHTIRAASSKGFGSPMQLDRTVFAGVEDLVSAQDLGRVAGNERVARDTADWLAAAGASRPFFALLWLDHSDLDVGAAGPPLPPDSRYAANPEAGRRWDRYRHGLRIIDGQVGGVLAALGAAGLDGRTLVVAMGDHGFEFDDLGLGYYGHASNYARWQLRTPLWLRWPGRDPRAYAHRTSHLDLPVTLLEELFGCRNPAGDYAMGRNLFAGESWDWLIAGSYHSFAIVEPERIVVSSPGGLAQLLGPDYRELAGARFDAARIEEAIAAMRRWYR